MLKYEAKLVGGLITIVVTPRRVEIIDKHCGSVIVDHKTGNAIADAIRKGTELINGK
jgi:hypothetical protein